MLNAIMTSPQHLARTPQFHAQVTSLAQLSPRMRRVIVTAPEIATQHWPLGCDVAIVLTGQDGREVRRRYTVRSVARDELIIDAVLHGDGVGSSWAANAQPGDQVVFFGPRGEIGLPTGDDVLALTDESGLPAVAALMEAVPGPVVVLAEIAEDTERYPLPDNAQVTWLARDGRTAGDPTILLDALASTAVDAHTCAYVIAESRGVLSIRDALTARGVSRSTIYAKGYWNLKSRPTR